MTRPGLNALLQPLFQEIPVATSPTVPLGVPPSWARVVVTRAGSQCECAGQCGVAHAGTANRCPRRHGGWHRKHETKLALAPKDPRTPLHKAVTLPDAELMAWCDGCLKGAEKLAQPPA